MSARAEWAAQGAAGRPTPARIRGRGRAGTGPRALPRPDSHVVLVTSRTWGIGDQAALDTFLQLTSGPVALVAGASAEVPAPYRESERIAVHVLPDLLGTAGRPRKAAVLAFLRLLEKTAHCTVLASEEPGGGASAEVAVLARTAAERGIDTRVIGFTWPYSVGHRAIRAVRSASRAGVSFFVYDDLDRIRAMNDGVDGLRRAVDLRFASAGVDRGILEPLGIGDAPFALVDASAAASGGADPIADVIGVVAHLQRRGIHVLLLPQDARAGSADRALCVRVAELLGRRGVQIVDRSLRPAELRALAAGATVVVTGRAAVAVLASTCAVPVIGLAADRAVAGALRLVGNAGGAVQPNRGFATAVGRLLDRVLDGGPEEPVRARPALPELVTLARASLDGLPAGGGRGRATERSTA